MLVFVFVSDFLGFGNVGVFLLYAFLTNLFVILYLYRSSDNFFISFVFYVCFGGYYLATFNHVRQYLAVSVFLFSLRYIEQRRPFFYMLFIFFAVLTHYSAVLLFPLYYVFNRPLSNFRLAYIVAGYFLLLFFSNIVISYSPYAIYLERVVESERSLGLTISMASFSLVGVVFMRLRRFSLFFPVPLVYMSLFSGLLLLGVFFSSLPWNLFFRLNAYFLPFMMISVSCWLSFVGSYSVSLSRVVSVFFCLLFVLYYCFTLLYKGGGYNLIPYRSVLEGVV